MSNLKLNTLQNEAVEFGGGPLLIIAGAGTGKTTVITERIKYLILNKGVLPSNILALTFTEKAACEMQERVDIVLPYGYSQMWILTFHSFGDRILRNEAVHIGLDPKYRLMTEAEAIRFIRDHLFEFDLHYFRPLGNPTKFIAGLFQHFSRLKDEDISPSYYLRWANSQNKNSKQKEGRLEQEKWQELARAYQTYENLKVKEGVMDFADLISNTLKLFRQRPNVLEQYKRQFQYILVDEFQDTNIAQYNLLKLLAPPSLNSNLTVVGDDSQSIYKFRGAAVSNILYFMDDYKKAKTVILTENYRSTQPILDSAYRLIQFNNPDTLEARLGFSKNLVSTRNVQDAPYPELIYTNRVENEAEMVAKKIVQLIEQYQYSYSDFAILVRANSHAEPFARMLGRYGIPYQFLGPAQLFRQEEVKEIIAYLKVLYDLSDSTSFYKVLTSTVAEHFDITPREIAELTSYARKNNLSLFETAEKSNNEKIQKLVKMIHQHLAFVPKETAGQIAYRFCQDTGLLKSLISPRTALDEKRAQNIAKFFDKLKTYEIEHEDASIFAVVDWIELSMELGESPLASDSDWTRENAVNILTVHSAKGLEFPVVFIVNLVLGRFPTRERKEQIPIPEELIKEVLPQGDYHLQEERRLFYVAMTRARDRLYLTASDYYGEGKRERKISPFVVESLGNEIISKTNKQANKHEQLSILDFSPANATVTKPSTSNKQQSINYLSYSQIDTFRFCPLHYKLKYLLNVPTPPTAAQSFGTVLHQTLQQFYQLILQGVKMGEKELLEIYEKNWTPLGFINKAHEQTMKKRGRNYLLAYLTSNLHQPDNPPLCLEKPFTFPLTPDLKIGGKIDRIDKTGTGIEIIDYKTTDFVTKKLPTEKELACDLQLSIYALAAKKVYDPVFSQSKGDITLSLYFLDQNTKVSTKRTPEQLQAAEQEILRIKKEIENSDFACSGNFWCKDCEYKLFCEAQN